MLNDLRSDRRKLVDLARRMENYDATLAAHRAAGKPIELKPAAVEGRKSMEVESMHLCEKWSI
jgi:hypothetical protein